MIYFSIPGLYEHIKTNEIFYELFQNNKQCFYDDFSFDAFYGNFQYCIWDGGRIFPEYHHTTLEDIQKAIQLYNHKMKVPMRFIYTNTKIEPKHCYDRFCNLVTEMCENPMNEIVVNSLVLEDYLRKTYPKYKYISSTTKCLTNKQDFLKELHSEKYSRICLDYNLNKQKEFLNSLNEEEKDRCEFLINATCGPGCPNRKKHYNFNSESSLNYGKTFVLNFCTIPGNNLYPYEEQQKVQISPRELRDWYAPNGFSHFKLEGRTFKFFEHLGNLIYYMVKPEYQLFVFTEILHILES